MVTATVLTLREFEELADDGKRHELNQGELVSVTHPKFRHSWVAQNIHDALSPYVREKKIGRVFSGGICCQRIRLRCESRTSPTSAKSAFNRPPLTDTSRGDQSLP